MSSPASLVDVLRVRAETTPDALAFVFLDASGAEEGRLTYRELDVRARRVASRLAKLGFTDERALLLLPPGLDYVAVFFGCLYARTVAVPAYPPDEARLGRSVPRIQAIATDAGARVVITTKQLVSIADKIADHAPELRELTWLDAVPDDGDVEWKQPVIDGSTLAFLQYTSGSTGTPKGVMLTHGNLLANSVGIRGQMEHTERSVMVSWVPPFHDMGLIVGIIQPVFVGFPAILMAPLTFVREPGIWLEAISKYRGTTSAAPNFAYDLCVRKIPEEARKRLDLSSWDLAINAAEPVRSETMSRFSDAFGASGFASRAFYPAYGLAECTVMTSGGKKADDPIVWTISAPAFDHGEARDARPGEATREVIGCGTMIGGHVALIVDPETRRPLAEGRIGEIWIGGPSIAAGYWARDEESREVCRATTDSGEGPYLRTGDLGLMRGPEIFVTGRAKDLIILRGQNFYPQDIELTAERAHPALRPGCGAAFSIERDGEERLVVVHEIDPKRLGDPEQIFAAIRGAVSDGHGVRVQSVALVAPGSIQKTSSGKIQRRACKTAFLAGRLELVAGSHAEDAIEAAPSSADELTTWLAALVAKRLNVPVASLRVDRPAAEFGLDSITSVELANDLSAHLGVHLSSTIFWEQSTIASVAKAALAARGDAARALPELPSTRAPVRLAVATATQRAATLLLEGFLVQQAAQALRVPAAQVSTTSPLHGLGLDSMNAVDLSHRITSELGVDVDAVTFLGGATLADIARDIHHRLVSQQEPPRSSAVPRSSTYVLSRGQQAIWFLHQLSPESTAYNIATAFRMRQKVDVGALRRSFQALVDRHASLRTTFLPIEGRPVQFVPETADVAFEDVDAAGWSEGVIGARLRADAHAPFDLEQGPLFRVSVYRVAADHFVLSLAFHHIVVDFWSISVLLSELGTIYAAESSGRPWALTPLTVEFPDFVQYSARLVDSPRGDAMFAYWQKELDGAPTVLELPGKSPRPPSQTFVGDARRFRLSKDVTTGLRTLAAASGATMYATLLAAFQVLLSRFSGQRDFLVGSPFSRRLRPEWAGLVGYVVNPVLLRARLADDPTFREHLARARDSVLGALLHQELPFPLLVERLLHTRDPSRPPFFQAMFSLQKAYLLDDAGLTGFALREPGAVMELGGLRMEAAPVDLHVAQVDLTLTIGETPDSLAGAFEYNTDLFDDAMMGELVSCFTELCSAIVEAPDERVSLLRILPEAERTKLVTTWNATDATYPETTTFALFAESVRRAPDRIALASGDRTMTYAELAQRSQTVAGELARAGAKRGAIIGVALEPSIELAVVLLAVMQTGAAYVPLDPAYPKDRLELMREDSGAIAVVTRRVHAARLGSNETGRIFIEEIPEDAAPLSPLPPLSPDDLAYALYTSGSTGKPKGVLVTHRNLVSFLTAMTAKPGLSKDDVLVSVTSPSFDIFGLELFLPLSLGARVVIAGREIASDGERLGALIERSGATVMQATPSTWRLLLESGGWGARHLRAFVGGEALPRALVELLHEAGADIWNMYGPTETTIWSTTHHVTEHVGAVPIGRPIANTRVYVLDARGNPVPVGVVGDLFIGGHGVARGYHRREDLTAERFLPDPFSTEPGARMYRTGDVARLTRSGALEYVGRSDDQVKLRGFRIELGEIEAVLAQHPAVRDVAVVLREDGEEKRLIAYVVTKSHGALFEPRGFLGARLPEYMIPAGFVLLDELPLTPNGKHDRGALARRPWLRDSRAELGGAPRNELEEQLADIWALMLNIPAVGIHDNFFELGGHSLLATQLMSRVRTAFDVRVPLTKIFDAPTVAGLARVIATARGGSEPPPPSTRSFSFDTETHLPKDLAVVPAHEPVPPGPPAHIFLTGGTGFLGAYLLRELLDRTTATIHCLVRAVTAKKGLDRLKGNLRLYGLSDDIDGRVVPVLGDLGLTRLGLFDTTHAALAKKIDAVYHNGAMVDFVRPFRMLRGANVEGTLETLRLANRARLVPFHFISTLSVFPSLTPGEERVAFEDDTLFTWGNPIHGEYAKSKWAADRLMLAARNAGYPVYVYRPGIVYAHAETGVGKSDDFIHRMVKGCVALGLAPRIETWINLTPVDFVVRATVALSLSPQPDRGAFHLVNPIRITVREFFDHVRAFGYHLEELPYRAWRSALAETIEDTPPNDLLALLPYLGEDSGELFRQPFFDASNVENGLRSTDITCRPADRDAIFSWLARLVRDGILPAPALMGSLRPPPRGAT